jgi:putative intracellular protease/amidase
VKLAFAFLGFLITAFLAHAEPANKPILLVVSNHGDLGNTGKPTGFFLSEAAHPWEVFREAGYPVEVASPAGGFAPVDPKSYDLKDSANAAFWKEYGIEAGGRRGLGKTVSLEKVDPSKYAAIFFAGGHGAMWDFPNNPAIQKVASAIYEQGGAVGAVCHGPAALVGLELSNGNPLVEGRKVAPFTNAEEAAVGLTSTVPFLLEDRLKSAGATPEPKPNFQENAVLDGRLATGQNPASAVKTAKLLVQALQAGR